VCSSALVERVEVENIAEVVGKINTYELYTFKNVLTCAPWEPIAYVLT